MAALDEAKVRFPDEKVESACRASIKLATPQKAGEEARRSRVFLANSGTLVVMKRKMAFLVDRRNYYLLMGVIALTALMLSVVLLLGPLNLLTLATFVLGALIMAVLEGFIYFQMTRGSVLTFDRAAFSILVDTVGRRIMLSSADAESYEITVTEGEEFPKL